MWSPEERNSANDIFSDFCSSLFFSIYLLSFFLTRPSFLRVRTCPIAISMILPNDPDSALPEEKKRLSAGRTLAEEFP